VVCQLCSIIGKTLEVTREDQEESAGIDKKPNVRYNISMLPEIGGGDDHAQP
jgi:hypothetical protein